MVNAKKKGNAWENRLSNWFRDHGFKTWKDGMSGGGNREKGDIGNNLDLTIESKACKSISLMEWWRQVSHSASLHGNSPALFIHQDGMPDNEWLVVQHSSDWIEDRKIITQSSGKLPDIETGDDRQLKWALEALKAAISKVTKLL